MKDGIKYTKFVIPHVSTALAKLILNYFHSKNKTSVKINTANENTLSTVHNITLLLIQVSGYTTKLKIVIT